MKKSASTQPDNSPPHLYEMARNLNLERRLHPRVKFPMVCSQDFTGPLAEWEGHFFSLVDLSEGGLCLDDPGGHFLTPVGKESRILITVDEVFEVPIRVVGSNIGKRHVQFLDAGDDLKGALREWVQIGLRGQWLRPIEFSHASPATSPLLWTSRYDDWLMLSADPRWEHLLSFNGQTFCLPSSYWPVYENNLQSISERDMDTLLVAFENLNFSNALSESLKQVLCHFRRGENG